MTFVLVRGSGRGSIQLRVAPVSLIVTVLALVIAAPAGLGFVGAQDFAPDPQSLSARAYLLMQERGAQASLLDATRRISFENLAESFQAEPPRLIFEPFETAGSRAVATPEERRGILRVRSLHLGESIAVRPFDQNGDTNPQAFAAISKLWRCRFTGHEVPVDPHLIRLLTKLNDIYDREIHLVSGHRTPNTVGTRPTSQHNAGTAADVRIPGVSARKLQGLARSLGARGVGLYTHKHFVHIDFRRKKKYFWVYPEVDERNQVASAPVSGPAPM
ncbi:MAG: DUF882 domain-containing protein [Myxococcales bacterium]|nr:DUF882 domain-containing protein [Myxococcales bacterium]MDD9970801.1 DUF882 domain-containing protein [Myxococcales bacterium]